MWWLLLFKSLYFFLPAYFANMSPVLFRWLPLLNKPIHQEKLGAHKTWRGIIVATVIGTLTFALQKYAYTQGFISLALIDYGGFSIFLGTLLGFGAMVGDAFKSYYKRKAGIQPGYPWLPWDQLDFVIGGLLFGMLLYVPSAEVALALLLMSPLLHLMVNYIGYLLKINKSRY
ncbi:CDP-archaeol synthase [Candidatus Woesearchaeota archaeon]|nr:CDP-archaeol synthase [Candidatus Woesearchaeota archaeon]